MVSGEKRLQVLQRRRNRRITAFVLPPLVIGLVALSLLGLFEVRGHRGERRAFASLNVPTTLSEPEKVSAAGLYAERCSACHGTRLEGATGPALAEIGERRAHGKIARIILNGKGRNKSSPMPGGLLNAGEADLVARWLLTQDVKVQATRS